MNSARKTFDVIPDADMLDYAYWYDYDHRGLVTLRKLPGREAVRYIYDPAGRLAAEQDGNSAPSLWTIHLYDRYGREVVTGNARWTETLAEEYASKVRAFAHTGSSRAGGYSHAGYSPAMNEVFVSRIYNSKGQLEREEGIRDTTYYSYDHYGFVSDRAVRRSWGSVYEHYIRSYTGKPDRTITRVENYKNGTINFAFMDQVYDTSDRLVKTTVTGLGDSAAVSTIGYDRVGRMTTAGLGSAVNRTMAYDVHGWLDSAVTVISRRLLYDEPSRPVRTAAEPDGAFPFRAASLPTIPGDLEVEGLETRIVERLLYAGGKTPCYNGNISARIFDGGRYDYTYDSQERLISAAFTAPSKAPGADYSAIYAYDANCNITSLTRKGLTNVVGLRRTYGVHDRLSYTYTGNQLTTLEASPEGKAYEGRTGIGTSGRWTMAYDANGNLVSDGQRGITSVTYNHLDQPTGITMASGEEVSYMYGHAGNRLLALLRSPSGATVTKRAYIGPAIFENDTLKMWLFPGGYFDAKFEPHYYVTDYQGNITHDVTSSGYICQKTNYYPYGEPWQEPKGDNRYLFGGKERENLADLRLYDFGPRMLNSAAGRWYAPDKMSEKYFSISPYAYCAGNPVRFIDPSGFIVIPAGEEELNVIINTLPHKARSFIRLDNEGKIDADLLNSYEGDDYNTSALKEIVNSDMTMEFHLGKEFEFLSPNGMEGSYPLSCYPYDPNDSIGKDEDGTTINGVSTGEEGNLGKTLFPDLGGEQNSKSSNIIVIIHEDLSPAGAAETYSHEANGHVLLYLRNGHNHKGASHDVSKEGMIDRNTTLVKMILKSKQETIKNMRK